MLFLGRLGDDLPTWLGRGTRSGGALTPSGCAWRPCAQRIWWARTPPGPVAADVLAAISYQGQLVSRSEKVKAVCLRFRLVFLSTGRIIWPQAARVAAFMAPVQKDENAPGRFLPILLPPARAIGPSR